MQSIYTYIMNQKTVKTPLVTLIINSKTNVKSHLYIAFTCYIICSIEILIHAWILTDAIATL